MTYRLGQTLYYGNRDMLSFDDGEWRIIPGEMGKAKITAKTKYLGMGGKYDYEYHVGTSRILEKDMPGLFYLTKEEALEAWKPSNKEILIDKINEKIEWEKLNLKSTEKNIDQLNKLKDTL